MFSPLIFLLIHCKLTVGSHHDNLQISVSMPCVEVGTIGGGTFLGPQAAMLDFLGVRGAHPSSPGDNARQLARVIAAATLAGELSLCAALAAGHLVQAHMSLNRSAAPTRAATPQPGSSPLPSTGVPLTPSISSSSTGLAIAGTRR